MENATKALLIAAAVLIAILVISLGIVVYNMASETIGAVNFSDQEITAFNDKFTQYEDGHVRGSEVNAMLKTVLDSNMKTRAEGIAPDTDGQANALTDKSATDAKYVQVSGDVTLLSNATALTGKADTSKMYKVVVKRSNVTGFVNLIEVNKVVS